MGAGDCTRLAVIAILSSLDRYQEIYLDRNGNLIERTYGYTSAVVGGAESFSAASGSLLSCHMCAAVIYRTDLETSKVTGRFY
jgi:hypothetical protein